MCGGLWGRMCGVLEAVCRGCSLLTKLHGSLAQVNLLIAMFSDTYSRIIKEALTEYHFQRYLHVFEYQHVIHAIPPPFNLPLLLLELLQNWSDHGSTPPAFIRPLPPGATQTGGNTGTLSRKYVQQFLKSQAEEEFLSSTSQVSP